MDILIFFFILDLHFIGVSALVKHFCEHLAFVIITILVFTVLFLLLLFVHLLLECTYSFFVKAEPLRCFTELRVDVIIFQLLIWHV